MNHCWLVAKSQKLGVKVQIMKFHASKDWYGQKRKAGLSCFSETFAPPLKPFPTVVTDICIYRSLNATATFRLYLSRSTKLLNQCHVNLARWLSGAKFVLWLVLNRTSADDCILCVPNSIYSPQLQKWYTSQGWLFKLKRHLKVQIPNLSSSPQQDLWSRSAFLISSSP